MSVQAASCCAAWGKLRADGTCEPPDRLIAKILFPNIHSFPSLDLRNVYRAVVDAASISISSYSHLQFICTVPSQYICSVRFREQLADNPSSYTPSRVRVLP
jgi:hypothetical protein